MVSFNDAIFYFSVNILQWSTFKTDCIAEMNGKFYHTNLY